MTIFTEHPSLRWSAPIAAVIVLGGGGMALRTASAAGNDALPAKTAQQLLVDVQNAHVDGLSGTIVEDADLGLPDLPISGGGNGSSKLSSLISGSHTMRVWADGTDRLRLSLLGTLGESDVIRNGDDLWLWSSADHEATHVTLPTKGKDAQPTPTPSGPAMTPQQLADHFLSAVQPSTKVTTDNTTRVAGRAAYDLVLSPRAQGSLIDSVHIAIDGKTHVPLRVQVFSEKAENPAFQVGFSSVDFSRPDAAQFRFNPPPGTKVTQQKLPDLAQLRSGMTGGQLPKDLASAARDRATVAKAHDTPATGAVAGLPSVVGKDWTSVLKVKVPDGLLGDPTASRPDGHSSHSMEGFLLRLPHVRGDWGSGRLLQSNVMSALLTDSGTLYVGAVTPEVLYAAAAK